MLECQIIPFGQKALLLPRHVEENTPIHQILSQMSNHEFAKTALHQFTSQYCSNPTRSHINQPYVTNTFLYLPEVHWGYYQTLIWSQLAMVPEIS